MKKLALTDRGKMAKNHLIALHHAEGIDRKATIGFDAAERFALVVTSALDHSRRQQVICQLGL